MSQTKIHATHGFHATMTARPGHAAELIDLLLDGAPTNDPCCLVYLVGRSASAPDVVHVTEGWTTREAHAENFARAASQALVARIAELVVGAADYQDLVPVGGLLHA